MSDTRESMIAWARAAGRRIGLEVRAEMDRDRMPVLATMLQQRRSRPGRGSPWDHVRFDL